MLVGETTVDTEYLPCILSTLYTEAVSHWSQSSPFPSGIPSFSLLCAGVTHEPP